MRPRNQGSSSVHPMSVQCSTQKLRLVSLLLLTCSPGTDLVTGGSVKEENFSISCNHYVGVSWLSFPLKVLCCIVLIGDCFHSQFLEGGWAAGQPQQTGTPNIPGQGIARNMFSIPTFRILPPYTIRPPVTLPAEMFRPLTANASRNRYIVRVCMQTWHDLAPWSELGRSAPHPMEWVHRSVRRDGVFFLILGFG